MIVLGIETSCDETACALVKDGREVLSNIVYSQIPDHADWGGVIPELASRLHIKQINPVIDRTIQEAKKNGKPKTNSETELKELMQNIDAIAVSNKPGLIGSLLIGVNVAKTLAWIYKKPIIPVNHLHGHICANYIDSDLEPPFLCLLASGGHTQIIKVTDYENFEVLGETIDDAAGEAFDKVARLFDLPYPGGPELDNLAQTAKEKEKYSFTISKVGGLDFSFSGLKTAVLRLKQKLEADGNSWKEDRAEIAYGFQDCVAKTFAKKIEEAIEETGIEKIVIAGGVAANSRFRELFTERFADKELIFPGFKYCTDNAAMIASAGYFLAKDKLEQFQDFSFEVESRV